MGEPQRATLGSTGRPGPSALEHHPPPASSAAGSLQHHSPPHQLQFGGYSCFSSQRGSHAALQQPLSSTFACQRDFIPLRRGSEGHGGKDRQDRAAGMKQFEVARCLPTVSQLCWGRCFTDTPITIPAQGRPPSCGSHHAPQPAPAAPPPQILLADTRQIKAYWISSSCSHQN